jgi:hypothetical protein
MGRRTLQLHIIAGNALVSNRSRCRQFLTPREALVQKLPASQGSTLSFDAFMLER